jgi:hypothetical protein
MDLLTLFFIALVVLALVWFLSGKKESSTSTNDKVDGKGEDEYGELDEVGADISEAY